MPAPEDLTEETTSEKVAFDMFLNFKTNGLSDDFLAFKAKSRNNPFAVIFSILAMLGLATRGVMFNDVKALVSENPVFRVYDTYVRYILIVFFASILCIAFSSKQSAFIKKWNYKLTAQNAYDTSMMFAGTSPGVRMIGRVVQGTCPPDTSVWHSQVCNTNGAMNELPMDTLFVTIILSLALQVCLRSFTPTALFGLWVVNFSLINIALYLVESPLILYMNIYLIILGMTSYEIERGMMQMFLNQKFALASAEANTKLKVELICAQVNEEKRALDSKREMVRHIAHEIRTPLNIVTVATDIILAELKKIDSVPQFVFDTLYSCQEACAIGCDIVNDLLNFEKLAAGLVTLEKMPMVLSTYVQGVLNPFYVSAGAKDLIVDFQYTVVDNGQELVVNNPENVADVVEIDSVKMSSVLRNLLSNSIKFAKETIVVKVSVVRKLEAQMIASDDDQACSSGHAVISVKDDGAGISSGNLSRLFQEGVQFNANELQKGGGSGFGLYIAKGIVDLHTNSRMWAESEGEGKGATFFLQLPLSDVVLPPQPPFVIDFAIPVARVVDSLALAQRQSSASVAVGAVNASKPPLVILVVDDSAFTRRLTIQLLKLICEDTRTCTFIEAVDGQEAVACVTKSLVSPMLTFTHARLVSAKPAAGTSGGFSGTPTPIHTPRSSRIPLSNPRSMHGSKDVSVVQSRRASFSDKNSVVKFNDVGSCSSINSGSTSETEDATAVQIDIVFMDYNMPRMVRIIIFPSRFSLLTV